MKRARLRRPQVSPKRSIIGAADDDPHHLGREWLDAVHVGNDTPRTLLARGPATASAFAARPARLKLFRGLAMRLPLRV